MLPAGTYVKMPKDMVFGIWWKDIDKERIDLDLSLMAIDGKFGWDSYYRRGNASILFSGDVTAAPNGATELFYTKKQDNGVYLMMVNYFNFNEKIPVPTKVFVAEHEIKTMKLNYMVDPNNVLCSTETILDKQQKVLGLALVNSDECRFFFNEVNIGNSITSINGKQSDKIRDYLKNTCTNPIELKDILIKAGAILCETNEEVDIDLSLENLTKNSFIDLLIGK
jgi:hypothetical protein